MQVICKFKLPWFFSSRTPDVLQYSPKIFVSYCRFKNVPEILKFIWTHMTYIFFSTKKFPTAKYLKNTCFINWKIWRFFLAHHFEIFEIKHIFPAYRYCPLKIAHWDSNWRFWPYWPHKVRVHTTEVLDLSKIWGLVHHFSGIIMLFKSQTRRHQYTLLQFLMNIEKFQFWKPVTPSVRL